MMEIWFDTKNQNYEKSENFHESLAAHLSNGMDGSETLIFTNIAEPNKLGNGFTSLNSHFHTNVKFRGTLRSLNDKFLQQALTEFIQNDDILPVYITNDCNVKSVSGPLEDYEQLNKVSINKAIDLNFVNNEREISTSGFLAVQKHFSNENHWNSCEENSYNLLRLGKLKNELDVAEAILRDADYVDFNINAIKHGELPDNINAPVTGLTVEEACQLMKYIGFANGLKLLTISGYDPSLDHHGKIAECIAMMLWYFIEGRESNGQHFEGLNDKDYQEYLIQPTHLAINLKFYKHKTNGKWWVKLPKEVSDEEVILSCSKRDYFMACNDEVSERLMQAIAVT